MCDETTSLNVNILLACIYINHSTNTATVLSAMFIRSILFMIKLVYDQLKSCILFKKKDVTVQ